MTAGTQAGAPVTVPGDEALLGAVLAASTEAFVLSDDHGRITEWNPAAERTFGFSRGEVLGLTLAETIVPPELRASHQVGMERFLRTGEAKIIGQRLELTACHKTGRRLPIELTISAVQVAGGRWRFAGLLHDISERRAAEAGMRQLAAIVDTVDAGAVAVTLDGRLATWNPGAEHILGRSAEATIGQPLTAIAGTGGEAKLEGLVRRALGGETVRADTQFTHGDGRQIPIAVSLTPLLDAVDATAVTGASVLFRDITRHKVAEERLAAIAHRQRELAKRDDLTGLFNLRALHEGLAAALVRAGSGPGVSTVRFDLEGLRIVNDLRGPAAGDAILRAFGGLLLEASEETGGWAARIAGDEFALVLPGADRLDARRAGRHVVDAFGAAAHGAEASFGVASSSAGARSAEALLHAAERDLRSRRVTA